MRILLVRAPVPPHTMGLKHIMVCEPLELEYVAAGLAGHDVQMMDLILERGFKQGLRLPPRRGRHQFLHHRRQRGHQAVPRRQALGPRVRTVVGGVHAAPPEDYADPSIDCIVPGDGTTVMPEVVRALETGQPLEEVPGLVLPREGGWQRTAEREYMPHPDSLPFPRRDLVAHLRPRYYYLFHQPVATMKTTWGCWYKCNFCFTWRITDGTTHSRSPSSSPTSWRRSTASTSTSSMTFS